MAPYRIIAVDGLGGSGKGTLARMIASYFKYNLLDSGAIYRVLGMYFLKKKISLTNTTVIRDLVSQLKIFFEIKSDRTITYLDNVDITKEIRREKVGMTASKIATSRYIRTLLINKQYEFSKMGLGLVADGRDMGTVVFPDAKHKFFLKANVEIRAKRRFLQLLSENCTPRFKTVLNLLKKRDKNDCTRKMAPSCPSKDAIIIDTTNLNPKDVFELVLKSIEGH